MGNRQNQWGPPPSSGEKIPDVKLHLSRMFWLSLFFVDDLSWGSKSFLFQVNSREIPYRVFPILPTRILWKHLTISLSFLYRLIHVTWTAENSVRQYVIALLAARWRNIRVIKKENDLSRFTYTQLQLFAHCYWMNFNCHHQPFSPHQMTNDVLYERWRKKRHLPALPHPRAYSAVQVKFFPQSATSLPAGRKWTLSYTRVFPSLVRRIQRRWWSRLFLHCFVSSVKCQPRVVLFV